MDIIRLNLLTEPVGDLYRDLLDHAVECCEVALLVLCDCDHTIRYEREA